MKTHINFGFYFFIYFFFFLPPYSFGINYWYSGKPLFSFFISFFFLNFFLVPLFLYPYLATHLSSHSPFWLISPTPGRCTPDIADRTNKLLNNKLNQNINKIFYLSLIQFSFLFKVSLSPAIQIFLLQNPFFPFHIL